MTEQADHQLDNHELDNCKKEEDVMRRFGKLESDMMEIKSNMAEMKTLMLGTAKTYAQAAATSNPTAESTTATSPSKTTTNTLRARNQATKDQQRAARRPYEVKLTNQHMPENVKREFEEAHIKDVLKKLQSAINEANIEGKKPTLQAGNKYPNSIRLQCDTIKEAQLLRNTDITWGNAFQGLKVHVPKYGIVIHGIPKDEIKPEENQDEIIARIEMKTRHSEKR